jgi:hypothetical protein
MICTRCMFDVQFPFHYVNCVLCWDLATAATAVDDIDEGYQLTAG